MAIIHIQDGICWCCGIRPGITQHHGIPQHLKPKNNIVVPLCKECHDKVNNNDVSGMYSYAYKIEKTTNEMRNAINKLYKMMKNKLGVENDVEKTDR